MHGVAPGGSGDFDTMASLRWQHPVIPASDRPDPSPARSAHAVCTLHSNETFRTQDCGAILDPDQVEASLKCPNEHVGPTPPQ